jgi:protein phosphatase 1 regulatory subunit 12A
MTVVKLLVEAGADVNSRDHEGWTPFHVAASWNNYDGVRRLQEVAMIDYAATTWTGESALDLSGDPMFFENCLNMSWN